MIASVLALTLCGSLIAACGNTIQDQPLSDSTLLNLVTAQRDPIYWLGASFHGLPLTNTGLDPGGAYTLQYGDCVIGGSRTCIAPVEVISSPDNSFLPGAGTTATTQAVLRGVHGLSADGGKVLELATGPVVVDVRARSAALARAAIHSMVSINLGGAPAAPLPKPLPSTGFNERVLNFQRPSGILPLPAVPPGTATQVSQAAGAPRSSCGSPRTACPPHR